MSARSTMTIRLLAWTAERGAGGVLGSEAAAFFGVPTRAISKAFSRLLAYGHVRARQDPAPHAVRRKRYFATQFVPELPKAEPQQRRSFGARQKPSKGKFVGAADFGQAKVTVAPTREDLRYAAHSAAEPLFGPLSSGKHPEGRDWSSYGDRS